VYKLDNRALLILVGTFMVLLALLSGTGRQWGLFVVSLVVLGVCIVGMCRTHKDRKTDWADEKD
jgi:hypothetical protein